MCCTYIHGKNSTNLSETTELEAHAVHTYDEELSFSFSLLIPVISLPTFQCCFAFARYDLQL
jgi:hypothetical protein